MIDKTIPKNEELSPLNYTLNIDNQAAGNYTYDRIGNLISDAAEQLDEVRWTVYGKINRIVKTNGGNTVIDYGYDPGGNRTYKKVNNNDTITSTFYIRDAQGNVLAIYSKKDAEDIKWDEQHLYGSSRLGIWRWDTIVSTAAPVVGESNSIYDSLLLGNRAYELSNHLGNVLSTISDKKIGNDSSGIVNYYIAEVLSQNDYYPGGMLMPGRKYSAGNLYRYGFNGKENDNDVKGEGNQQDYGMRIYDPRLGKFLSVDPLISEYSELTPYQFASNRPIDGIDLDGKEWRLGTVEWAKQKEIETRLAIANEYKVKNMIVDALYSAIQSQLPGDNQGIPRITKDNEKAAKETLGGSVFLQSFSNIRFTKIAILIPSNEGDIKKVFQTSFDEISETSAFDQAKKISAVVGV